MRPFLLLLLFPIALFAQTEQGVPSEITAATVYLEGAEVRRTATTKLPAGRTALVFRALTAKLDPTSVQLSANSDELLVLSVEHRLNFGETTPASERENRIVGRIERLNRYELDVKTEVLLLRDEEAILQANRQVAGAQNGLDAQDLRATVEFQRERMGYIKRTMLILGDTLHAIADRRETLQLQLGELGEQRQLQRATSEFVVLVKTDRALRAEFDLRYLVPEAGWNPRYDLRVANTVSPVDLRYRAAVYQNSGEDWSNVNLTLSTGDPSENAVAPELQVWRLAPNRRPPVYQKSQKQKKSNYGFRRISGTVVEEGTNEPLIGASIVIPGTTIGVAADFDGKFSLEAPSDITEIEVSYTGYDTKRLNNLSENMRIALSAGAALDEVVVTGYGSRLPKIRLGGNRRKGTRAPAPAPPPVPTVTERRATTVAFQIELPYDIPADGRPRNVEINRHELPASYQHFAVPKVSPNVYLTAAVTGWEDYNLVSGEAQLFFEGTFLGTTQLNVDNTNDTLRLSLGRDQGVVVKRTTDREFKERAGFLSGKQVRSRGYVIEVRNTKAYPINLRVTDQVPISGQDNIEIDVTLPRDARLKEDSGIFNWEITLPPREERTLRFGYEVKYPKGMMLYL